MEDTITVRMIDGELGAVIPAEMLRRLDVAEGDTLFVEEARQGLLLMPRDPECETLMERYRRGAPPFETDE